MSSIRSCHALSVLGPGRPVKGLSWNFVNSWAVDSYSAIAPFNSVLCFSWRSRSLDER